jgi:phosphoesterase RecJ-like protein
MVLKQTSEGSVKGSLRTTRDDVDVSLIAQKMGGGGHKKSSGIFGQRNNSRSVEHNPY